MKKSLLFVSVLILTTTCFGQIGVEYFERGSEKYQQEDFTGALSEFSKFIEIDPNQYAFFGRGLVKLKLNDEY